MGTYVTRICRVRQAIRTWQELVEYLDRFLVLITEGIIAIDGRGCISYVNAAAVQALGYPIEGLRGRKLHAMLQHTRLDYTRYPETESVIQAVLRDGRKRHVSDQVFWNWEQRAVPVEHTASPYRRDGVVCGVVVSFHDSRAQSFLKEARVQVESKSFTSDQMNQLDALLTAALAYCQFLRARLSADDPAHALVSEIQNAALRSATA